MGKLKKLIFALSGLGIFTTINISASLFWIKLKEVQVNIDKLPKHLEGLRILQISDIHNTSVKKMDVDDIWENVFQKDFDIAVITGDMTQTYFDQVLPFKAGLKRLSKRAPVFFVDGNHEKTHFREMKNFLESCGVTVLDDKKTLVEINGGILEILGTRDYYYQKYNHFRDFKRLMENETRCGFRILLSHQPQIIDKLSPYNDILVISGHTHGGQVRLPFMPVWFAPGQGLFPKYARGLYQIRDCYLYISSGIGASRIPIRLFNRPEIAILTLRGK